MVQLHLHVYKCYFNADLNIYTNLRQYDVVNLMTLYGEWLEQHVDF